MKRLIWTGLMLLLAATASAQAVFVNLPNGALVPCDHPLAVQAGRGCVTNEPPVAVGTCVTDFGWTICSQDQCRQLNPYTESDRASACALYQRQFLPTPNTQRVYAVGAHYQGAYPNERMRVLSITTSTLGHEVVTCEWVSAPYAGRVFAILNIPNSMVLGESRPDHWRPASK